MQFKLAKYYKTVKQIFFEKQARGVNLYKKCDVSHCVCSSGGCS